MLAAQRTVFSRSEKTYSTNTNPNNNQNKKAKDKGRIAGVAMDMSKHLKPRRHWLNDRDLVSRGGRYEAIIVAAREETMTNPFTLVRQLEPVISFEDGVSLVPNLGIRRTLVAALGLESDAWIGRRVVVIRDRVERTNAKGKPTKQSE